MTLAFDCQRCGHDHYAGETCIRYPLAFLVSAVRAELFDMERSDRIGASREHGRKIRELLTAIEHQHCEER